ncbi:hypothetical protein MAM1_0007c00823 [Mucor ambiguus]|uniref:C3HC-type domain-containing protein n=1 Tax=Mucor ambiguus TaxID=91626 RepID=A0A0C9LQC0_9FUNG|nr:hypothetical protein MAM1_0007c00823 [Mucor ambiguus]
MDTPNEPDTSKNTSELRKEALELCEFIKKVRVEANLGPVIKSKRSFSLIAEAADTDDDESRGKRQQLQQDQAETDAAAQAAAKEAEAKKELIAEKRHQFFRRLSSFSPRFYYRKRPFTALECAKYGWRDTHLVGKKDAKTCILQCDDCQGKMFVITFDPNSENPKVKEITNIYKESLISCHAETCQWRNGPDADVVYNFPIQSLEDGVNRLQGSAFSFIFTQNRLKSKISKDTSTNQDGNKLIPPLQHPLEDLTYSRVCALGVHFQQQRQEIGEPIDTHTVYAAYLLSLFGWRLLSDMVPGIRCDLCCSKRGFHQVKQGEKLNVLKEHKEYCPWVNPETADVYSPNVHYSNRDRKICGYEWMVDLVAIEYSLITRGKFLSLSAREATDEKRNELKQKMYKANELLKLWDSYSSGSSSNSTSSSTNASNNQQQQQQQQQ